MNDTLIQIGVTSLALICCILSVYFGNRKINPVTLISVFFFAPLVIATFRLSGLQSSSWSTETYAAFWLISASWLVFPTILIMAKGKSSATLIDFEFLKGDGYLRSYRFFALLVALTYLASNYLQAQTLLPILKPERAYELHTEFPPILRLFARCIPAAVGLAYIAFSFNRRKFDFFILLLCLAMPITRLSRIDVALSFFVLLCVFIANPLFQLSIKRIFIALVSVLFLVLGSVELGNQRTNRFGLYEVKYERAIQWTPQSSGPAAVYAVLYGYFPLSFENFDLFVDQTKGHTTLGLLSFDWFFSGVVKLNRLSSDLDQNNQLASFKPLSTAANVPTALLPFYSDFGLFGMTLPAMFYMYLWIYFFYNSARGVSRLLAYSIFTAAFCLSSFQALIAAPIIFHQIVFSFFVCFVAAKLEKIYVTRNSLRIDSVSVATQKGYRS